MSEPAARRGGLLDRVERLGNALPDPTTLFLLGALAVMAVSELAVRLDWSVSRASGELVRARSLLGAEGLYWTLQTLVQNFVNFPPLGVVLVGMLGIGVAERSGLIGALLKRLMVGAPQALLTPLTFLAGILSSIGLDAGYVVLPPLAAALYKAMGRSPLVGLGAVFAGVSAGFSANLVVTSLDPLLAELSTASARTVDPAYQVAATANWWFMAISTFLLTGVGWAVTAWWVEPRYAGKSIEEGGAAAVSNEELESQALTATERRALAFAGLATVAGCGLLLALVALPGMPLHGEDGPFPRWVRAIVPLLFVGFLVAGLVYGIAAGSVKSDKDVAGMMSDTMAGMGGYIVLAFFAAQFIAWFGHSNLGEMLAIRGGQWLAAAALPTSLLMVAFVGLVFVANLFVGSMSAKYAFLAPVFVPMFMQVGVSPELTQVAYRIGDSVSNVITPLNPYVVIILVFMRRFVPRAGIGSLLALMVPYTLAFSVAWTALLVVWIASGLELGPSGPLMYGSP